MTNSNVRNSDSAYSISFGQVLLNLFIFLKNTTNQRYRTFWKCLSRIQHSNPAYLSNGQTNKQTKTKCNHFNTGPTTSSRQQTDRQTDNNCAFNTV